MSEPTEIGVELVTGRYMRFDRDSKLRTAAGEIAADELAARWAVGEIDYFWTSGTVGIEYEPENPYEEKERVVRKGDVVVAARHIVRIFEFGE